MGNKVEKIINLTAKKFNKKRKFLKPIGITLDFCLKDGEDNTYTNLTPTVSNFYYDYDSYKEATKVMVATLDTTFQNNLKKASDIKLGSDYFQIDKRDIKPPDGDKGYWQFYCRTSTENY